MGYTCLTAADAESLGNTYSAEIEKDPLYKEYRTLFGIG